LLKHEPSAQIPWQKTMLGLPFELAICKISSRLRCVLIVRQA
jgi:hypothetical protein